MFVIGIVGGIASGKSTVTECFRRLGAEVVHADELGHAVLGEPQIRDALCQRWGSGVLDETGALDRKAIAKIVFTPPPRGPQERAFLEELTHPRIAAKMQQRLQELAQQPGVKGVVLDAPILLEAGWDKYCDKIIYVEAARSLRLKRAGERGWTEAEFSAREAAQKSLDEKRKCADWVIDNSHSPEATFAHVQQFWRSLS